MLLAALDVGGTKTDAVLFDETGHILCRSVTAGANPLDCGLEEACKRYENSIRALGIGADTPIDALYAGIACYDYFGGSIGERIKEMVTCRHLTAEGDGPCLLYGMLGEKDGAALICGTGSSLTIRVDGKVRYIGGCGWLVDGCSSGYILGRDALNRAVKMNDGRIGYTPMKELIEKRLGGELISHLSQVYAGGRAYIASLCGVVFEALDMGDPYAEEIVDGCVKELCLMIHAAAESFGTPFPLVLNGGVIRHFPEYEKRLRAAADPRAQMIMGTVPPVYGGAFAAARAAGLACGEEFRRRFMTDYDAMAN
ncbi:MAG: hypothetical protein MJ136_00560 [Clostridia bacterium]|nr:hypothetical protein [Clostridia bacterium]